LHQAEPAERPLIKRAIELLGERDVAAGVGRPRRIGESAYVPERFVERDGSVVVHLAVASRDRVYRRALLRHGPLRTVLRTRLRRRTNGERIEDRRRKRIRAGLERI